jgi:hypothetical protein
MRVVEGILNWRASTGAALLAALLAAMPAPALASPGSDAVRAGSAGELAAHRGASGRAAAAPLDMRHVVLSGSDGTPIDGAFLDLPLAGATASR